MSVPTQSSSRPLRTKLVAGLAQSWRRVQQLRHRWAPRVPFVPQFAQTDCGPACLAMVLAFHGKRLDVDEVRDAMWSQRDGVDVPELLASARKHGLRARGVRVEALKDLVLLPRGSILHWRFHHFVVIEAVTGKGITIVDPAVGRRRVPWKEVDRSFTGIAMVFEPGPDFQKDSRKGRSGRRAGRPTWFSFLRPEVGTFRRILLTSFMLHGVALAIPLLTGIVVDRIAPSGAASLVSVLAIGVGVLLGFQIVAMQIRAHLLLVLRVRLDASMSSRFLEHLMSLPFAFFQGRSHGDLLQRLRSNSSLRETITSTILSAALDGVMVLSYLVLLLWIDLRMGAVAGLLGAIQLILLATTWRRRRELETAFLEVEGRSRNAELEILGGMETLKAAGAEDRLLERWSQLYTAELNATLRRDRLGAVVDSLLDSLRFGSPLILLLVGTAAVIDGRLTLGAMLALNALALGFLTPLSQLISSAFQLQGARSYLDRIEEIFSALPEQADEVTVQPARLTGEIALQNVSFRYGPRSPWALHDVSLKIRSGSFVALVGPTAAGKSTLAHLLLGLYQPEGGEFLYDGQELNGFDLRALRRQVAFVPQNPFLFGGTLRSNIALFDPQAPLEKVVMAARRAQIHDEIVAMPLGYETPVGGAAVLSGGQLQRVVLARALLAEPAILVLDEATSALDTLCEARVQAELEGLACTRIVIAHRLSTLRHADQIVVLDEGRIVEVGSHQELLAAGGFYAELLDGQLENRAATPPTLPTLTLATGAPQ